jgi:YHS domain-containing protein
VTVGSSTEKTVREGVSVFFCSAHCRARFEAEPDRYGRVTAP